MRTCTKREERDVATTKGLLDLLDEDSPQQGVGILKLTKRLGRAVILFFFVLVCVGFNGCKSADEQALEQCLSQDGSKFKSILLDFELDPKQEPTSLVRKYLEDISERETAIDELKATIKNAQSERLKDVIALLRTENDIVKLLSSSFETKESLDSFDFTALQIKLEELSKLDTKLSIPARIDKPTADKIETLYKDNLTTELDRTVDVLLQLDEIRFETSVLAVKHEGTARKIEEDRQERQATIEELKSIKELSPRAGELHDLLVLENRAVSLFIDLFHILETYEETDRTKPKAVRELAEKTSAFSKNFKQEVGELQALSKLEKSLRGKSVFLSHKDIFDEHLEMMIRMDDSIHALAQKRKTTAAIDIGSYTCKDQGNTLTVSWNPEKQTFTFTHTRPAGSSLYSSPLRKDFVFMNLLERGQLVRFRDLLKEGWSVLSICPLGEIRQFGRLKLMVGGGSLACVARNDKEGGKFEFNRKAGRKLYVTATGPNFDSGNYDDPLELSAYSLMTQKEFDQFVGLINKALADTR